MRDSSPSQAGRGRGCERQGGSYARFVSPRRPGEVRGRVGQGEGMRCLSPLAGEARPAEVRGRRRCGFVRRGIEGAGRSGASPLGRVRIPGGGRRWCGGGGPGFGFVVHPLRSPFPLAVAVHGSPSPLRRLRSPPPFAAPFGAVCGPRSSAPISGSRPRSPVVGPAPPRSRSRAAAAWHASAACGGCVRPSGGQSR